MWARLCLLAWRNIWRQKRRTALTLVAIALGLGILIFTHNLVLGMRARIIAIGTGSLVGHGQFHAPGYLETGEPEKLINGVDAILARAREHPKVVVAAPRIFGPVLAAIGSRSASLTLLGVDPHQEAGLTNWRKRLARGHWLREQREVLIGAGLAERMELEAGSKLVLTASSLQNGELNSVLVHVAGILATEDAELNNLTVVAPRPLAEQLLDLHDQAQEIAFRLDADLTDEAALKGILASIAPPGVEAVPWQARMVPLLKGMEVQDIFLFGTFIVVCLLAGLGIANTMGMSLLERIREFGMLQAIGTGAFELGAIVVMEYLLLGLLGALAGFGLGIALTLVTRAYGIPMGHVEVIGMIFSDPLYPALEFRKPLLYATAFFLMVPTLAVLPLRNLLRRDPAASLRFNG